MFGHQSNNDQASQAGHGDPAAANDSLSNGLTPETVAPTASTPSAPIVDQSVDQPTDQPTDQSVVSDSEYVMTDLPTVANPAPQPVSTDVADPVVNDIDAAVIAGATPLADDPIAEPAPAPAVADSYNAPVASTPVSTPAPANPGALLELKQSALHDLSPLLGQLEQSPEEKFRTTMMMIQASDDQSLLQSAYDAARQISDEKVRAQALLDVVNEINYFTQQGEAPNLS